MRDIDYGYKDCRDYYQDKWVCNSVGSAEFLPTADEMYWKWQDYFAERKERLMEQDKTNDTQCKLEDIYCLLEKYVEKTDKLLKKVNKLNKKLDGLIVNEDDYFETECPCCGEPLDVYIYEE